MRRDWIEYRWEYNGPPLHKLTVRFKGDNNITAMLGPQDLGRVSKLSFRRPMQQITSLLHDVDEMVQTGPPEFDIVSEQGGWEFWLWDDPLLPKEDGVQIWDCIVVVRWSSGLRVEQR